jgi:hypothetical protein
MARRTRKRSIGTPREAFWAKFHEMWGSCSADEYAALTKQDWCELQRRAEEAFFSLEMKKDLQERYASSGKSLGEGVRLHGEELGGKMAECQGKMGAFLRHLHEGTSRLRTSEDPPDVLRELVRDAIRMDYLLAIRNWLTGLGGWSIDQVLEHAEYEAGIWWPVRHTQVRCEKCNGTSWERQGRHQRCANCRV